MPGIGGTAFCTAGHEFPALIPLSRVLRGRRLGGAADCLGKPVDAEAPLTLVDRLLA